ncbi:MAG: GH92 family glycosyl hydrolase [Candidatus Krumholzibacteria bacterium]|nr:GH92 family glycosyl hydrolase [Candidatus Krumholzibacteria bacterium]
MRRTAVVLSLVCAFALGACSIEKKPAYTSFVDPFIGTAGHGHTYPGATVPFGGVQLSPDTRLKGWDGCSGYHYSDSVVYGFSHTHLSGAGASDYGDILLMPTVGAVQLVRGDERNPETGYCSRFGHKGEEAAPGYYRVKLDEGGVVVELTATKRAGFHRYIFPKSGDANVIIDLAHRDEVIESHAEIAGNNEIVGFRRSRHWADDQYVYFAATFSKPFGVAGVAIDDTVLAGADEASGTNVKAFASFRTAANEAILVKVGISGVDIEGARRNRDAEIPGWDFEKVRIDAGAAWNAALGKIDVRGGTQAQRTTFYTALYHAMLAPNLFMDVDGRYRGRDLQIHKAKDFTNYTVFSLWDTYRAEHPLFTIVEPERTVDFIKTFLAQYEQGGLLPVWELAGNETNCMIGYHAVPVIVDAYVKGIRGFDAAKAFEAMKHSAEIDFRGLAFYRELGYIPSDKEGESVSKTLEYAYDDWCIAQMAKVLGAGGDYAAYIRRAQSYKNLFDPSTGFMRAKVNGAWWTPFDPAEINFNYTEANAWQYSFYVPQDVRGLIGLMGGDERFAAKLDSLFSTSPKTSGLDLPDVSGLIGQYAHGNEPSHHMAYLYSFAGRPWKTQERARSIMDGLYHAGRDGLCGNEDCGQMSAWYVLSALGFYPVTPGSDVYVIGTPLFREASIDVGGGKRFVVRAKGVSRRNFYVQSAALDGKPYAKPYLRHGDVAAGGELAFVMGAEPNTSWGVAQSDRPASAIVDSLILPVPFVASGSRIFSGSTEAALGSITEGARVYFTLDGGAPGAGSSLYRGPIPFMKSGTLNAVAIKDGFPPSAVVTAEFRKIPGNRGIRLNTAYSTMYPAGGDLALIDGLRGPLDFRTGLWQGYEGIDLDATVDLGRVQRVSRVTTGFLQDQNSWLFLPEMVEYSLSSDGRSFVTVARFAPGAPAEEQGARIENFASGAIGKSARYVRVFAKNAGVCPAWHRGAGEKAWIFADEIVIE